jgi:endo-1,4-beta-xylanase
MGGWTTLQRTLVALIAVLAVSAQVTVASAVDSDASVGAAQSGCQPEIPSTCTLRQLAGLAGIRIGSTAEASEVLPGPYADTLAREFNSLTPENAMKWYTTNPAAGVFEFADADQVVAFADANTMEVRAHTLLWTQDTFTPSWVLAITDRSVLEGWVAQHIATVAGRYAGQVPRWDVVNEPLVAFGTTLSDSVFHRLLPPDWMVWAFNATRAVDPDAELWINEYGTDWVPGKHEAFVALVQGLLAAGAPLDGVGLQVHRPGATGPDRAIFERQLRDFTDLGLSVAITELDIPIPPGDDAALDAQATAYRTIVEACLAVVGCEEVTVWGVTDANTWLNNLGIFPTPTRPLLFDDAFTPKPAYAAVRDALAAFVVARDTPQSSGPSTAATSPSSTPTHVVSAVPAFTG